MGTSRKRRPTPKLDRPPLFLTLTVSSCSGKSGPSWCRRSQAGVLQVRPRSVGGRGLLWEYVPSFRGFHLLVVSPVGSGPVSSWACGTCAVLKAVSQCMRRYPWSVCVAVSPVCVLVSHVADCCPGTLGDFVVICTFLLFGVFCLGESAVDSDCSCWETPGRFLHHVMGRLSLREQPSVHAISPVSHAVLSLRDQSGGNVRHARQFRCLQHCVSCFFKHSSYFCANATSLT